MPSIRDFIAYMIASGDQPSALEVAQAQQARLYPALSTNHYSHDPALIPWSLKGTVVFGRLGIVVHA